MMEIIHYLILEGGGFGEIGFVEINYDVLEQQHIYTTNTLQYTQQNHY